MPAGNSRMLDRFIDFINSGDEAIGRDVIAQDAIFHVAGQPEPLSGLAGYMQIIGMMRGGFPDIQWRLEETIVQKDADGDVRVAARFIMTGTHQGVFLGIAPTGHTISVQAMNFYRLANGRIVEERGQPDIATLMRQIG